MVFAAFIFGFVFRTELSATTIPTPEHYEQYLEKQGDPESLKLKEQFSLLPLKKKQKLLRYFFDPEVMNSIYSQNPSADGRKVLYNGDVVIENKSTVTEKDVEESIPLHTKGSFLSTLFFGNVFAAPTIKEYSASHVKKINVAGTWIKYNTSIRYQVKSGKVVKITTGSATITKFLWLNTVTRTSFEKYITVPNNMAHGAAIWETTMPLLKNPLFDISPVSFNSHHQVHGYSNGKVTHSFWEQ